MSRHAANPAALPHLSLSGLGQAYETSQTRAIACDSCLLAGPRCQFLSSGDGDELPQQRRRRELWSRMCQPSGIPPFARSLLRGLSGALRQLALLLRLRRPTGYGFPSGPSVNAELRHLGAGPSSLFSDPSKIGKFNQTETPSCTRTK